VIAVYDSDRIHRGVGLPSTACKIQVKAVLKGECIWKERLKMVFLERNIETVVHAVQACAPKIVPEELWRQAVDRKDRNARDVILRRAAAPHQRALRDCILGKVPSLAYLINELKIALSDRTLPAAEHRPTWTEAPARVPLATPPGLY
jgi:hypothetical protein